MAKDNRKKKKSCVPLDGYQAEQLAKLIIAETEKEGALRHGKKETDCGTQRCRNSFLNATFLPISPSELFTDGTDGKPHNLITQENYEYLRDSLFQICTPHEEGGGTYTGTNARRKHCQTARRDV